MMKIKYVIGDATNPQGEGLKIIPHVCNDIGAWGAGFVLALSKKWKEPEAQYRAMEKYSLGTLQCVPVDGNIIVANIIGQRSTINNNNNVNIPPVRYVAIDQACVSLANIIIGMRDNNVQPISIHAPFFGCGLAGGKWYLIKAILEEHFIKNDIPVTMYGYNAEELKKITGIEL